MYVESLKNILPDVNIRKVVHDIDQDPFVLYERKYTLTVKSFSTKEELKKYFAGKKHIVAKDFPDDLENERYRVKFWIHND